MQAGAAELVLLDQGDGQAQLGGAQRAGVAAAAAAEDDDVEHGVGVVRHDALLAHSRNLILSPGAPTLANGCADVRNAGQVPYRWVG